MKCEQNCCISLVDLCSEFNIKVYDFFFPLKVEDEPNKISDQDRTAIKANIINLMLSSPEQIQKQVHYHMSVF